MKTKETKEKAWTKKKRGRKRKGRESKTMYVYRAITMMVATT